MRIAVIDGQGGGIGKSLVEKIKAELGQNVIILALGTNALATSVMLKAGANEGASGENAIIHNVPKVDVIVGTVGIVAANSMMGELSPLMAQAISDSPAKKILIPLNKCNLQVVGVTTSTLPELLDKAVLAIKDICK